MRMSWLTGFALLYVGGMVISLTLEGVFFGSSEVSTLHDVMNPDFLQTTSIIATVTGFFGFLLDAARALWAILWWDYSFLQGSYEMLRYVGWAASLAMMVSIIAAIRGVGSS